MTALETGLVLGFIGVVAAGVQGGLIRPLAKRFDEAILIRCGHGASRPLAFLGLAASPSFGRSALYAAGGLLALGNGLTQPSVSAYVSKRADPKAQGGTLGTNQSAASLARVFGPALGGCLYGAFGPRSPYVAGAIGMVARDRRRALPRVLARQRAGSAEHEHPYVVERVRPHRGREAARREDQREHQAEHEPEHEARHLERVGHRADVVDRAEDRRARDGPAEHHRERAEREAARLRRRP